MNRERAEGGGRPGRRLSRRDFLKVGGAGLAGAALLAGCGGGGQEQGANETVVFSFGPDDSGTLRQLIDRFNAEAGGGVQVEYREMSRVTDEYFRELRAGFEANDLGIDVIGGDVIWATEMAENGWIEPLSDLFYGDVGEETRRDFLPAAVNSVNYQNEVWGIPWFTAVGLLYYRRDLLEGSGFSEPPRTWDELKQQARRVQQDSGTRHGFVFQGAEYEGGVVNGCEYVWTAGGDVLTGNLDVQSPGTYVPLDDPNVITIDSPSAIQGLRIERSMIEEDVSPPEVAEMREDESADLFLTGDSVFLRGWPFMYALAAEEGSRVRQDQIGVAPLPIASPQNQSFSCLGGWNMYLNASSNKRDAAHEFIRYATAPEQQRFRALEGSFLPTLTSLYEDQEIRSQVPVVRLSADVIPDARSRPVTPYYSEMSARMARAFNASLRGAVPPEQAVRDLQGELQNVVEERGGG